MDPRRGLAAKSTRAPLRQELRFSPAIPETVSHHDWRALHGRFLRRARRLHLRLEQALRWNLLRVLHGTALQKDDLHGRSGLARFLRRNNNQDTNHVAARSWQRYFSDKRELHDQTPVPLRPDLPARYSSSSRRHGLGNGSRDSSRALSIPFQARRFLEPTCTECMWCFRPGASRYAFPEAHRLTRKSKPA